MGAEAYPATKVAVHPSRKFATGRTTLALILREMVTTYGRSPGGYIWALLEPIAGIALLSFAFSLAFHAPSLGNSFPLFYATAYLPYMLFHDVAGKTATAIRFSRPLLNFGAVSWFDVVLARFLLNLITHLMITIVVLGVIIAVFELTVTVSFIAAGTAMAMAAVLALGVGALNCYLFLAFPAWERVWVVATRPLFIISGVFFLFEDIPAQLQSYLWFNPIFHITGQMRRGFYATYSADYISPAYAFGLGCAFLFIGLAALSRTADGLIHK